ncbi:protein mono-ADP-ribosyltransferase PARP12 isoform X2 [Boleophthalmus pectinirostris]|uniref:protein mono-ADP-ribosyltransferase PARP12 isoform X2 n=1 Tax=Boleophthalmus pectinirostris TaxID=150288 RepID=UPI00242AC556|nr:protein mono-ADP-ribosyltransferase PARP12 isoform X2 [Boleophthalmus pectinirostris]
MIAMETVILRFILSNGGAAITKDLLFNLCDTSTLLEIINNDDKFVSCSFSGTPKIVVRSRVRLCRAKECPGCGDLHLCKVFLLSGSCKFTQLRRGCLFSHDMNSDHNVRVLRANGLETLSRSELCLLLLQSDPTLLPQICHDYNRGSGSSGQCREGCHRLHICERFQDCSCYRNHDFFAPQPLKLLQEKQIPENLMGSLKSVCVNKDALRLADQKAGRIYRGGNGNMSDNLSKRSFSCGNLLGAVDADMDGVSARRSNQRQRDKTEICMYFIKGHCKHEDRCYKAHDKMPYRWEIRRGGQWTPMAENETIEKDYSDPQNTYSTTSPPVHFDTMTCGSDEVRRLSTVNSVLQPDFIHTTDWLWYWEDEYGTWYQYGAVSSEHRMASITSKDLEEMYVSKEKDVVEFSAGSHKYSINLQDMIQTNLKYNTKRLVRRRPKFVSAAEVQTTRKRPANSTAVPDYWDKTQISQTGYKRVIVPPSSDEYKEIQELFSQTMTTFNIIQIERIQNKALWEAFQLQKIHMKNNNGRKPVLEKKLFHGTDPKFVDTICATNFDWRVCGVNGTSFGQGSYFARDASYSHRYTGDSDPRSMFVSRVLVGEFTKGSSEYRRPPSKDGGDVNLFDSCVNNITTPSIFVIFEKHQIYPEYLLQYEPKSSSEIQLNNTLLKIRHLNSARLSHRNTGIADSVSVPTSATTTLVSTPFLSALQLQSETRPPIPRKPLLKHVISNPTSQQEQLSEATETNTTLTRMKHLISNLRSQQEQQSEATETRSTITRKPLIRQVTTSAGDLDAASWRTAAIEKPKPASYSERNLACSDPKPVVIPSCFTSSLHPSQSVVPPSQSSTSSFADLLEWAKKNMG